MSNADVYDFLFISLIPIQVANSFSEFLKWWDRTEKKQKQKNLYPDLSNNKFQIHAWNTLFVYKSTYTNKHLPNILELRKNPVDPIS